MTETQKEVLEITTAMVNREALENLCRSEVTKFDPTKSIYGAFISDPPETIKHVRVRNTVQRLNED